MPRKKLVKLLNVPQVLFCHHLGLESRHERVILKRKKETLISDEWNQNILLLKEYIANNSKPSDG